MNPVDSLKNLHCEIATDNLTRQLYATDASIYQVEPVGVAFPRSGAEASEVIVAAKETNLSVIPRGAGSGLVGGAIGQGMVVDFSRHLSQISDLDLDKQTVRVGAGVVLDQLNRFLSPHGYRFGPDVATSSRATLGGMIANNSSGAHVPVYGTTVEHVNSLEVVLADGSIRNIGANEPSIPEKEAIIRDLVRGQADRIAEKMPPGLLKRWPGYAIDHFLKSPEEFQHLFAGSEGTLAAFISAELKIVPKPKSTGVGLIFFPSVQEAMQATVELLDLAPAAIEHIDRVLFDQTRGQIVFQKARDLLQLDDKPCEAILIVEFFDDVEEKLEQLKQKQLGLRTSLVTEQAHMHLVWELRKAGLALLTGCKGSAKPTTGIEDTAVRPEQLPEYVSSLQGLLDSLDLEACFYGHAAAGLLHVRPVLDLHSESDRIKFRQLGDEVSSLIQQFNGSLAAEHGVGIARTEYMEKQLGPELVELMRQIKQALDPTALFNPGKVIPTDRFAFDKDLRHANTTPLELPFPPRLAFAAKDESFVGNLEQCNGCGGCRKATPTMCPTYVATGDELMSTRGRANLIRAALEGHRSTDALTSEELDAALSNCLACKACASECPSNVNLALLKAELIHARQQRDGFTLRERLLSSVDFLGQAGTRLPELANQSLQWPWLRSLLHRFLGISDRRPLPAFAAQRFDHWFDQRDASGTGERGTVYLWDDTFARYHEPNIGKAAVEVLEAAGYHVKRIEQRECCGRPAFSQGNLEEANRLGALNLKQIEKLPKAPILFLEPSCYSMFVEDYRELSLSGAEEVATRCHLFEEWIATEMDHHPESFNIPQHDRPIAVHGHCHAKAILDQDFVIALAQRTTTNKVRLLETGCCGMAGAFGAMSEKYDLSVEVAQPLVEQLEALCEQTIVVASGTSCRHQISHLTNKRPVHMAELLSRSMSTNLPE